ncbi:MAG: serine/threonine-protein phosphatase, partial [Gammaproteobacteria bacterium]|nr:serine/threonine-protein phosphatase [Gammaproteobacteria bacterium]
DVAAATVRGSVLAAFASAPTTEGPALRDLLLRADRDVAARQAEGGKLSAMRSTVVLAAIDLHEHRLAWAHCGDSRAYLFRGGVQQARTVDHSLVQQMVAGGMIDEEGARLHPQRNMLLSALGSSDGQPEISVSEPMALAVGDVLLLCSDGIWEPLGDACLSETLNASGNPSQWMELLDARVRALAKPGHDNYTAVAVWVHDDDVITQLMP